MRFEEKSQDACAHKGGVVLGVIAFIGIGIIADTLERERQGLRFGGRAGGGVHAVDFHLYPNHVVLLARPDLADRQAVGQDRRSAGDGADLDAGVIGPRRPESFA